MEIQEAKSAVSMRKESAFNSSLEVQPIERRRLAHRLSTRREQVGLSRNRLAVVTGVSAVTIKKWESLFPRKITRETQARLESALLAPHGWLLDDSPIDATDPGLPPEEDPRADTVSAEIRLVSTWLARWSPRRTASYEMLNPKERRRADIFAVRYGVRGEESSPLQAVGDYFGLTRERVRQITSRMLEDGASLPFELNCINKLAESIKPLLPASIEDLDAALRPLLGESLSVVGANRFCREILARPLVTITVRHDELKQRVVRSAIDPEDQNEALVGAIREAALRMISSCGAAHLFFVAGAASQLLGQSIQYEAVVQHCKRLQGFEWLIEPDGWFWLGEERDNRLIRASIKILAVADQRVDAEDLLAGFTRTRRSYSDPNRQRPYLIEPPKQIVVEALRRVANIRIVQHNDVALDQPPGLESVLSATEVAVYRLMRDNGNVCSRHVINETLIDGVSIKHMALQFCLASSPILRQIDRGIFALRGTTLDPGALKSAYATVGGTDRQRVVDRSSSGRYHTSFEISEYMARVRVWSVPVALATHMVEGEYRLEGAEEPVVFARLPSGDARLKRFMSKLLCMGYSVGDMITLEVDPDTRTICVSAAAEEIDPERRAVPVLASES